jgi:hypothetical protein
MLAFLYILNVSLLLLHEIESGYEKEWEILKLPGKITGFLLLHIPVLFIFFYGLYCILLYPQTRGVISLVIGTAGFLPFLVHKILVPKKEHFTKVISNILIFGNACSGIGLVVIGILEILSKE